MRESIRQEILEEMKEIQQSVDDVGGQSKPGFFARELSEEERAAVSASEEFLEFIERSSKIVERALDMEYDILADYGIDSNGDSEDATGRRLKQLIQFYDERWSKKRMISDIHFSPKVALLSVIILPSRVDLCPSSPNSSSPLTLKIHPPHTTPMASFKYGTHIFTVARNTSSMRRATC